MAVEVLFTRTLRGLEPADEEAREALLLWKLGSQVKGTFASTRENPQRRYFYGLVKLILDNSDIYVSKDAAVESIKLSVGHVTQTQKYENGQWTIEQTPASIAGKSLNDLQWRDFNRRVEAFICEVLCIDQDMLAEAMVDHIAPGYRK